MQTEKIEEFSVIGLSIRTSNDANKAAIDIPKLWNEFMQNSIMEKIPERITEEIYAIYTDYEGDHTQPYTMILGCKVAEGAEAPEGMIKRSIEPMTCQKFVATGDLTKDAVINKWMEIWQTDLSRAYSADLEIYGEKATDPTNGEVEIFIALK